MPQDEPQIVGLAAVTQHKLLVLALTLLGVGAGYLFFTQQPPVFASKAEIMVTAADVSLEVDGQTDGETTRNSTFNLVERLTGRDFLERVFVDAGLADLPAFAEKSPRSAVSDILENLYVQPILDTDVVEMSYHSGSSEQCLAVLSAIVERFQAELEQDGLNAAKKAVAQIEQARDDLVSDIEQAEEEYRRWQSDSGLIFRGTDSLNVHAERLQTFEQQRSELVLARTQVESQLEAIRSALAGGGSRAAIMLMIEQSTTADGGGGLAAEAGDTLLPLLIEREQLRLEGKGKGHPEMKSLERKIELTRRHLQEIAGAQGPAQDLVATYVESLQQRIAAINTQIDGVNELFGREETEAKALVENEFEDQRYRNRIENLKRLFNAVVDNLSERSLTSQMNDTEFRVIESPAAGAQIPLHLIRSLAVGGVLGLILGALLGFLLEMTDKRFRSSDEIARLAGAPILGHIPEYRAGWKAKRAEPKSIAAMVLTAKDPNSQIAEAFRYVRTMMNARFAVDDGECRVIQVTSASPGDGKSSVAANIAVAYARDGKRTLLLDADLRRPNVAKLFTATAKKPGLSRALRGEIDSLDEVIHESGQPDLHVMPCGSLPSNPAEALSGMGFKELLADLRTMYEVVIVDTPPLIPVSDPAIIAPLVDGVLLVLPLAKDTRRNLEYCVSRVRDSGGEMLGVIVNKVSRKESSRYEYGQKYGYGKRGSRGKYGAYYGKSPTSPDAAIPTQPKRRKRLKSLPAHSES